MVQISRSSLQMCCQYRQTPLRHKHSINRMRQIIYTSANRSKDSKKVKTMDIIAVQRMMANLMIHLAHTQPVTVGTSSPPWLPDTTLKVTLHHNVLLWKLRMSTARNNNDRRGQRIALTAISWHVRQRFTTGSI